MLGEDTSEKSIRRAFDKVDTDKSGLLDKAEVAAALRKLKKSEDEIEMVLGSFEKEEISFEEFKATVMPCIDDVSAERDRPQASPE